MVSSVFAESTMATVSSRRLGVVVLPELRKGGFAPCYKGARLAFNRSEKIGALEALRQCDELAGVLELELLFQA
jgi:hypothetical protein